MRALPTLALLAVLASGCCRNAAAARSGDADPSRSPAGPAQRVVPGEYVFTVAGGTTGSSLQASLSDLAPRRIQPLGDNRFLVVFGDDPGLSRLSFRVGNGQILAVQPNYVYQALPQR